MPNTLWYPFDHETLSDDQLSARAGRLRIRVLRLISARRHAVYDRSVTFSTASSEEEGEEELTKVNSNDWTLNPVIRLTRFS